MAATIAHPSLEALSSVEPTQLWLPDLYEVPAADVEHLERETESFLAWIVVLGFVAFGVALWWAAKCRRRGGDPVIRVNPLKGITVRCYK